MDNKHEITFEQFKQAMERYADNVAKEARYEGFKTGLYTCLVLCVIVCLIKLFM